MRPAACYFRTIPNPVIREEDIAKTQVVLDTVTGYADRHGFALVAYHHDVGLALSTAKPSAFGRLLDDVRARRVAYVLVPSRAALSPIPEVGAGMAELISDIGGIVFYCDELSDPPSQPGPSRSAAQPPAGMDRRRII